MKAIEVAAGLIFRDGLLLIAQRYPDSHLGGLWEFPGGKRHEQESFEQCLARELMEELGVVVEVGPLVESLTHSYPEKTVHLRFFKCALKSGEPKPLGCADVRWVTRKTIRDYVFPEADASLLSLLDTEATLWL